jgi:hypothetical protein
LDPNIRWRKSVENISNLTPWCLEFGVFLLAYGRITSSGLLPPLIP